MTAVAHDIDTTSPARSRTGLAFATLSALSFGLSGALARGLLDTGWSPAAAVTLRLFVGAAVLAVPAVIALRGRWALLRHNVGLVSMYGLLGVAGCQLAYFSAVEHLQVGVALLIEYTAPVAVVLWMWLRHAQAPTPRTVVGAIIAALGLALVLDVGPGAELSLVGVLWALAAMVCVAFYFVVSADEGNGLPPIVLATAGFVVGGVALMLAGVVGFVRWDVSTAPAVYDGASVPWWAAATALGVVTGAVAYTSGIAASRRLGSRLASFAALGEVVFAMAYAWLLLDELPLPVQILGGLLILVGVAVVKAGEGPARPRPRRSLERAVPAPGLPGPR